jgi:hypothetical protein
MTDYMHADDPAVAAVLAAAAAPAEGPVPGEAAALAAYRSVHHPHRRLRMSRFSEKAKLIAAAVFGGVVVISGVATAATGSLPLVSHGHSHPHPATSHAPDGTDDDQSGDVGSTDDTTGTTTDTTGTDQNSGKGSAVSTLTHSLPQGHKGPAVCTLASNGKCQAGQHGQAGSDTHGKSDQSQGKNDATTHDKAGGSHGKSDQSQGKNDATSTTHGQSGGSHGQSGTHSQANGHASTNG